MCCDGDADDTAAAAGPYGRWSEGCSDVSLEEMAVVMVMDSELRPLEYLACSD